MLTLKKVNREIRSRGYHYTLYKGEGYFYFIGDDGYPDLGKIGESVYVYRLNVMDLGEWIQSLEQKFEEYTEHEYIDVDPKEYF